MRLNPAHPQRHLLRLFGRLMRPCVMPALLAVALLFAPAASASMLEIQFTGLNLDYDGTNIYDSKNHNTSGGGNPADADPLTSMSFLIDGNLVGSVLTTDIFADIYIAGVTNIPAAGGAIVTSGNGGAFGVDLLTSSSNPGWGLALDIDTMQFFYTGSRVAISVAGLATGLNTQSLPFGVAFDPNQPITIVFSSASLTNVTTAGGFVTGLKAAGTGNVAGTFVPEPSTVALACMGIAGLVAFAWRRRKS